MQSIRLFLVNHLKKHGLVLRLQEFLVKHNFAFSSLLGFIAIGVTILGTTITLSVSASRNRIQNTEQQLNLTKISLEKINAELEVIKNQDQKKINDQLQLQISNIETSYASAVETYERLLEIQAQTKKNDLDSAFESWTNILALLADKDHAQARAELLTLNQSLDDYEKTLAARAATASAATTTPGNSQASNVSVNNQPPATGLSKQWVETSSGRFMVSLVAADLGSTRVIVDTASGSDCTNDCPVLPLADYVTRNGGYAGINGSYFCPASYPSCADKKNSFDLLVMNKDKVYFNSANNVYSSNPAVIFGNGSIRFVGSASEWGRDTSVDSVLSNFPLLLMGGEVRFGGDADPKKETRGIRGFVANKGNTVYIGVVYNASVAESAEVMKAMGMDSAMNLDSGGSTALWSGGYQVGPGRNIPNAIVLVRK